MNFTSASKVLSTIQATDTAAFIQGGNRAKINQLFNGAPLLSAEDAKKLGLRVNCNLGEAPVLGQHGRRQYHTAFLSRSSYFTIRLPDAPPEKQMEWGSFITRKINKILKRSMIYFELQRSKWAAVLLHGFAPTLYYDKHCVKPEFVALEDIRFPTDAKCDFSNLQWFSVRKSYTEGELSRKVFGKKPAKGWNKPAIAAILDKYHDYNVETSGIRWSNYPEKMAELIKQNGGFYSGDAVPTIPLFHFYFLDDSVRNKPEWRLRIVADTTCLSAPSDKFLFDDGSACVAEDIGQLLQMQFGDLNNKPPFLIHSVRSMGFLLMEPLFHSNLLNCRFLQHVHEHMNAWVRSSDVQGKARVNKIDLYDKCVVPDGVTIVPASERHQINPQIVEMAQNKMQQLKQEAAVSYTQDSETGRQSTDETATAVMARVSQVNAMMSGMLLTARQYEQFSCEEICRRFCLRNSEDDDARQFQKDCREYGIPSVYVNSDMWEVEVEMPLGNGNPTMEMAQSQMLMQNRASYDPTAQQEILHEFTIAVTGDPRKAERWVPIDKKRGVTDGQEHAELAFSTLMLGVPVRQREGLPLIDQIETLIGLISGVISRIEQTGNMARADEIAGLKNAADYTNKLVQQLQADEQQAPRAKQYADVLGKLMNTVKGFEQRLIEQQKAQAQEQQGNDQQLAAAETQAKIQATTLTATNKAHISKAQAAQKMHHKEIAFNQEQKVKDMSTLSEEQRKDLQTAGDIHRKNKLAEAQATAAKASSEEN